MTALKRLCKRKKSEGDEVKDEGFVFTLHPLFFAFGVYYAWTGRLGVFLVYTLSALLHEFGHAHVATGVGFSLKRLSLMPYGASVNADLDGVSFKDEFCVLLAGPLANLLIAIVCVASWWFFPLLYPFTEVIFTANISLCLINLFPIGSLDGGKVLKSLFREFFSEKYADFFTKTVAVGLSSFLFICFIADCVTANAFSEINFSLLFFTSFALVGAFGSKKRNRYVKRLVGVSESAINNGVRVKRVAVSSKTKIKRITALMDANAYNEIYITDLGVTVGQSALTQGLADCDYYATIGDNLSVFLGK